MISPCGRQASHLYKDAKISTCIICKNIEKAIAPYLLVDTTQVVLSRDKDGTWKHYQFSLITREGERISIRKPSIDFKKYGSITQIVIDEGTSQTVLKSDNCFASRIIQFFFSDFDAFRKGINAETIDSQGDYNNKNTLFDCQRFCYYLQHGKEGTYSFGLQPRSKTYRNASHTPGNFYSMIGQTSGYGKNGEFRLNDLSIHFYMCLTEKVFISKFGGSGVIFSSFQHILDAYFPPIFTSGHFEQHL